jgi:hypothetical protein
MIVISIMLKLVLGNFCNIAYKNKQELYTELNLGKFCANGLEIFLLMKQGRTGDQI